MIAYRDSDAQATVMIVYTNEPVTPEYLAQRVAEACAASNALRSAEAIKCGDAFYTVSDLPQEIPAALNLQRRHNSPHDY